MTSTPRFRFRTSETDPLWIDSVETGTAGGRVGMTICPGKQGASVYGKPWQRDLKADIRTIAEWGSATVISLTEADEMATLGVSHIGEEVAAAGMQWLHMPITDMKAPDDRFDAAWTTHGPQVLQQLQDGKRVLVHCRGGMGRAGTVAAFILTRLQVPAEFAIQQVRAVRRGAIETPHQIAWLEQTCPALPRT
jgi:protein-tyrosine phosphatase